MNTIEKPFYMSSTLWINVLGVVALVLNLVLATNKIVDPDIIAILVAILNIANRFRSQGTVIKTLTIN